MTWIRREWQWFRHTDELLVERILRSLRRWIFGVRT